MHTVELLPDESADLAVRAAWRTLDAAGLPSQAGHRHPTNRPHLTLLTLPELPPPLRAGLGGLLAAALPLPLAVAGPRVFPGPTRTLVWVIRPDPALLALHARLWSACRAVADPAVRPDSRHAPGRWTPHLTLGRSRRSRAAWPEPGDPAFPALPPLPDASYWTAARTYDGATRTAGPLAH
ncbi:2'-5' RNA ligase family protein [Streptomyces physcomitrii]|uniref:2'-5' RNA ligase family protein n=1 Tax=Streptomyces physcomitrii TaxID=2724184 RepID=UPI00343ABB37